MNIKIVDSWLREYLKTKATPEQIAEELSLSAVSVERIEKFDQEIVYDIEVTSNRPDLMSVIGIAREAAVALSESGTAAKFNPLKQTLGENSEKPFPIKIISDESIVNRICAVVLDVSIKESPKYIKERLEASGIRSLNNLIDVTNYVMREIGHPTHVFDFDRLDTNTLTIRKSKEGEKIITLDGKTHILKEGAIVADNGKNEIIDLLGIMGTANSVVTEKTKKILFFIDNNEPFLIRKTSMNLGIRSEAAILNEKGVDPELAIETLFRGIELYKEIANGNNVSKILDVYSKKPTKQTVKITKEKIDSIIGIDIPLKKSSDILEKLGFDILTNENSLSVTVPSFRNNDVSLEEDVIEEIIRVFGYGNIQSLLPPLSEIESYKPDSDEFFWENRAKKALKYWGFTEVYTYSFVSEDMLEGPTSDAVTLENPLTVDFAYMRKTLIPSLLAVIKENKNREEIKIFEIANVYGKREGNLPDEILTIAGIIKKQKISFFDAKGVVEQLLEDFGIKKINFKISHKGGLGASIYVEKDYLGEIEMLENDLVDFELNFEELIKQGSLKKTYKSFNKYPPVFEDLAVAVDIDVPTFDLISGIKKQSDLIIDVYLLDQYEKNRTFHITYQSPEKSLSSKEISEIREKILSSLLKNFGARPKN